MEDKQMFERIQKVSVLLIAIACILTLLLTKSMLQAAGIIAGGAMSLLGFWWIIASSERIMYSSNASKIAIANYMLRYLIYGILFYIGMMLGMNAIYMLIGFSTISLSIKIVMLKEKKEG